LTSLCAHQKQMLERTLRLLQLWLRRWECHLVLVHPIGHLPRILPLQVGLTLRARCPPSAKLVWLFPKSTTCFAATAVADSKVSNQKKIFWFLYVFLHENRNYVGRVDNIPDWYRNDCFWRAFSFQFLNESWIRLPILLQQSEHCLEWNSINWRPAITRLQSHCWSF